MCATPSADTDRVLEALGSLAARFDAGLKTYVDELLRWNPQLGVVSKLDTPSTLVKLIERSVALWEFTLAHCDPPERVLDIGSGGGFPGVVWKLLSPDTQVTLCERSERKAGFLDRVRHRLGAHELAVVAADAADLASQTNHRARYDVVVMMAVGLDDALRQAVPSMLQEGGAFVTVGASPGALAPPDGLSEIAHASNLESTLLLYR